MSDETEAERSARIRAAVKRDMQDDEPVDTSVEDQSRSQATVQTMMKQNEEAAIAAGMHPTKDK
jgi:hypothetical protein